MKCVLPCLAAIAIAHPAMAQWTPQESGSKARLRGLSAVGIDVAWAGGARGTCLRTIDGGATWRAIKVPDSAGLDFRDVHGFDDKAACLLSIGPGELSRIYRTADAGASWTLQHKNADPKGFLDAVAFWDTHHGLALGDPVDGRFVILRTDDAGRTWSKIAADGMPEALPNEGAFAASGTCLVVQGDANAWFGTGGGASARVFRSTDRGRTWTVASTTIQAGIPSAGIFSLAFRDDRHGVAVGGDYKSVDDSTGNVATTDDGGRTWTSAGKSRPSGFRSAVAYVPDSSGSSMVAVGPSGADRSIDGGHSWSKMGDQGFHALGFGGSGQAGWAVGEDGRIARLDLSSLKAR
jgi:photosystem II stability/assembly factor-like uncharacterized protein